jgi:Na+/phosphate symporter
MNTTLTLMDLAGAVALLIWGVHMVQTGVTRAFGPQLRRALGYAFANRLKAFLAGLGVTAMLQSSTATGLMVTAFAAGGLVDLMLLEKSLMPLAAKRIKRGLAFSEANRDELRHAIERLAGNTRAAAAVFMTEDPGAARQLLGEKEVFRDLETRAT